LCGRPQSSDEKHDCRCSLRTQEGVCERKKAFAVSEGVEVHTSLDGMTRFGQG